MYAAGGGSVRNAEDYVPGKRDKVNFVEADEDLDKEKEMKPGLHYTEKAKKAKERRDWDRMRDGRKDRDDRDRYERDDHRRRRRRRSRSRSRSVDRDRRKRRKRDYSHSDDDGDRDRGRWRGGR